MEQVAKSKTKQISIESGWEAFGADVPPTPKQLRYIRTLARRLGVIAHADRIKTKTQASRVISTLLRALSDDSKIVTERDRNLLYGICRDGGLQ